MGAAGSTVQDCGGSVPRQRDAGMPLDPLHEPGEIVEMALYSMTKAGMDGHRWIVRSEPCQAAL